jgi:hypothetical protein
MHKLLTLALSLPLVACVVGSEAPTGDDVPGGGGGGGTGGGGGGGGGAGPTHLTASTTWSGTMDVAKQTIVDPGVTLTIAAGTTVHLAAAAGITVQGIVDVQGTKTSLVHLSPTTAGAHHGGFSVPSGGELKMTYAVQVGGGIEVSGNGKATVSDTAMSQAGGDFLVVGGGTVNVSYSSIGLAAGTDSTHCNMHFDGTGTKISVTHSNISGVPYGLMLYGGTGVDLTYNNWSGNQSDIATQPGPPVSADLSFGWFATTAPASGGVVTYTYDSPAAAKLTDAGPRL